MSGARKSIINREKTPIPFHKKMRHRTSTEGSTESPCWSEDLLGRSSGADSAYLSARALSDDDGHIYEDLEIPAPPRIAPVSGVLGNKDENLLRPIAFKPVLFGHGTSSLPSSTPSPASWERVTPSPAEFEAILREKEAEISHLRQTIEHNEQVIIKVYGEKEQSWIRDIHRMQQQYDAKLMAFQQSHNSETSQLKKEKEQMEDMLEQLRKENAAKDNRMKQLEEELVACHNELEETNWKVHHKSGEIALLKSQLRDCQGANASRIAEMANAKSKLKDCQQLVIERDQRISELERWIASAHHDSLQVISGDNRSPREKRCLELVPKSKQMSISCDDQQTNEVEWLKLEFSALQLKLKRERENMEDERTQWEAEKERVICYQKKLQMNYVMTLRKNKYLEHEVQQLVLELENKAGESQC